MLKVYIYKGCSTCRKALQWLKSKGVEHEERAIRETPPTLGELERALDFYDGEVRRLFNTSGLDYRAMDLKSRLPKLSRREALEMLSKNGNLVKRPFAVGELGARAGFKEEEWASWLEVR